MPELHHIDGDPRNNDVANLSRVNDFHLVPGDLNHPMRIRAVMVRNEIAPHQIDFTQTWTVPIVRKFMAELWACLEADDRV